MARVLEARLRSPCEGPSALGSENVPGLPRLASATFTGEYSADVAGLGPLWDPEKIRKTLGRSTGPNPELQAQKRYHLRGSGEGSMGAVSMIRPSRAARGFVTNSSSARSGPYFSRT